MSYLHPRLAAVLCTVNTHLIPHLGSMYDPHLVATISLLVPLLGPHIYVDSHIYPYIISLFGLVYRPKSCPTFIPHLSHIYPQCSAINSHLVVPPIDIAISFLVPRLHSMYVPVLVDHLVRMVI